MWRVVVQFILMISTLVLILGGFYVGYVKIGDLNEPINRLSPFSPEQASVSFALTSAIAWGWSVLGDGNWNARFNLAAAFAAAVSAGYMASNQLFPSFFEFFKNIPVP